jgi:hypothetical protein
MGYMLIRQFIFFANILPGIAFALDLIEATGQYGVQEVLLATVSPNLYSTLLYSIIR